MSYFGELKTLKEPVSEGAARADRALEAAARFADALNALLDEKDLDGAFLRILAAASATGELAVTRQGEEDVDDMVRDYSRQVAVGMVAAHTLAEVANRNPEKVADLLYVAEVLHPDATGVNASLSGLNGLQTDVRPPIYLTPSQAA